MENRLWGLTAGGTVTDDHPPGEDICTHCQVVGGQGADHHEWAFREDFLEEA